MVDIYVGSDQQQPAQQNFPRGSAASQPSGSQNFPASQNQQVAPPSNSPVSTPTSPQFPPQAPQNQPAQSYHQPAQGQNIDRQAPTSVFAGRQQFQQERGVPQVASARPEPSQFDRPPLGQETTRMPARDLVGESFQNPPRASETPATARRFDNQESRGHLAGRSDLPSRDDFSSRNNSPSRDDFVSRNNLPNRGDLTSRKTPPNRDDLADLNNPPGRKNFASRDNQPGREDFSSRNNPPRHEDLTDPNNPDAYANYENYDDYEGYDDYYNPYTGLFPGIPRPIAEEVLYEWQAPNRPHKHRSRQFFTNIGMISILLSLILFFAGQIVAVLVVVSLVFLVYVFSIIPPQTVTNRITTYGIRIEDELYYWDELGWFWFKNKYDNEVVNIEVARFPNRIILLVGQADKDLIKAIISEVLLENEPQPTYYERASSWLQEKIPLDIES